ncbi:hypothetical protein [Cryobacterium sp. 10I5]|uniref:hypothetical protein n=1 Tax=Cryobacterium sp. 10I5 TaxID=3048581 RepID=UPI002B22A91D|nr:hypothetical protein [Cryobacterium sp. 10I5]MEB0265472.1 hypothetical protein [Cryobacterium sp. 10I5]
MTIVYVRESRHPQEALGARVREIGLIEGLGANGVSVVQIATVSTRPHWPELFKFWRCQLPDPASMSETTEPHHPIFFVGGLPLACGIAPRLRKKFPGAYIHVDVCDSWIQLSNITSAKSWIMSMAITVLKRCLAKFVLEYVGRSCDGVSYISLSDYESDTKYLPARLQADIVPNSVSSEYSGVTLIPNVDGPIRAIADWSYPPNQIMLRETLEWHAALSTNFNVELELIGPGLPVVSYGRLVTARGWVDDLSGALDGSLAVLSLVRSGAGVKNKVLVPLVMGLPVIALVEGLNGIPKCDGLVIADGLDADEAIRRARLLASTGFDAPLLPNWSEAVRDVAEHFKRGPHEGHYHGVPSAGECWN